MGTANKKFLVNVMIRHHIVAWHHNHQQKKYLSRFHLYCALDNKILRCQQGNTHGNIVFRITSCSWNYVTSLTIFVLVQMSSIVQTTEYHSLVINKLLCIDGDSRSRQPSTLSRTWHGSQKLVQHALLVSVFSCILGTETSAIA